MVRVEQTTLDFSLTLAKQLSLAAVVDGRNANATPAQSPIVHHLPTVFRPKQQPWIKMAQTSTEEIIEVVAQCPSGALSIKLNPVQ